MIRLANVLVVHGDQAVADRLIGRLSANGYHGIRAATAEDAVAHATIEHPDLILVGQPDCDPVALAARLKGDSATADIPVLLLAQPVTAELWGKAQECGLDDVLDWGVEDAELFARLRPLTRLETMHAELRHRAAIAARFGVKARHRADGPEAGTRPAILVVGEATDGLVELLAADADITTSANLYEAETMLAAKPFDAAVLNARTNGDACLDFCSQVRNNPRLFNLPMVLVADAGLPLADAYRRGATRLFHRPVDLVVLRAAVMTLVRRQQLRWSIRAALFDSLAEPTRDAETGAYGRAFLDTYLDSRLQVAKSQARHLSVVFFYIPNIEGVRAQFGDDAALHLAQQLGQWIGGLLRAEDLVALYRKNEFCVVLPDTPLVEAEVVMHRIAGVLAYTDFAVREVYQPVKIWVQVGCTDAHPDDDLAGLLARAHRNLD